MTSLVVRFRSTLAFFLKRDEVMNELHPQEFPHWVRGASHFNLVDTRERRVIRFEAQRCIVRAEGQESIAQFEKCVAMALDMLTKFEVFDIFAMRLESIQAKPAKRLSEARSRFAERFLNSDALRILPYDENTDYGVSLQRREELDANFQTVGGKIKRRSLVSTTHIFLGPVEGNEIRQRWLEFKEDSNNDLYQTKPRVPDAAQVIGTQMSIVPKRSVKQVAPDTLQAFIPWAIGHAEGAWNSTLGSA